MAQNEAKVVGNQTMCGGCADKAMAAEATDEQGEMLTCAACGMQMAAADMVEVDGKTLCSHCVPAEHGTEAGDQPSTSGTTQQGG